ncbi:hypothetical protein [Asticcacaulis endophyticus]|uniref:Uncharacterized protein n=1 Tax=Asticcacaulis endophyticus TaxID=1395890 RepID=A0A918PUR5_9CAUL|nr:hypothetical protein [Asticcacaulis endophyticus]GGZ21946.1 hypothetical protein GCM10011273_03430 [Asticcacaulis endophyticus]
MSESTHKILCNACKVELKGLADTDPQLYGCPVCGISDTRDNVMREATEYTKEMIARDFQDSVRNTARKSKLLKFSGKPIPHGVYRFITDYKG